MILGSASSARAREKAAWRSRANPAPEVASSASRPVLPDRLEKSVAGRAHPLALHDQRFVHQVGQAIENLKLVGTRGRHRDRGLQRPSAGEDRESPKERLLRRGEKAIAPIHGSAQGLVSFQGGATAAGEQAEAIVEFCVDMDDGKESHARRRQFDRERNAVEPLADRLDLRF